MDGKFTGRYNRIDDHWQGGLWGKQIYEFTNDKEDPLTYSRGALLIRPDHHFLTDMGSVPKTLQFIAPKWFDKDRYPRSYIFHDSGYKHGGHWVRKGLRWIFIPMTRKQVDNYLFDMILAEGGSKANARVIWSGVRAGGWASWMPDKAQFEPDLQS